MTGFFESTKDSLTLIAERVIDRKPTAPCSTYDIYVNVRDTWQARCRDCGGHRNTDWWIDIIPGRVRGAWLGRSHPYGIGNPGFGTFLRPIEMRYLVSVGPINRTISARESLCQLAPSWRKVPGRDRSWLARAACPVAPNHLFKNRWECNSSTNRKNLNG